MKGVIKRVYSICKANQTTMSSLLWATRQRPRIIISLILKALEIIDLCCRTFYPKVGAPTVTRRSSRLSQSRDLISKTTILIRGGARILWSVKSSITIPRIILVATNSNMQVLWNTSRANKGCDTNNKKEWKLASIKKSSNIDRRKCHKFSKIIIIIRGGIYISKVISWKRVKIIRQSWKVGFTWVQSVNCRQNLRGIPTWNLIQ